MKYESLVASVTFPRRLGSRIIRVHVSDIDNTLLVSLLMTEDLYKKNPGGFRLYPDGSIALDTSGGVSGGAYAGNIRHTHEVIGSIALEVWNILPRKFGFKEPQTQAVILRLDQAIEFHRKHAPRSR